MGRSSSHRRACGPPEERDTARRRIIDVLTGRTLSAREISSLAGISEKDVSGHLEHIRKSLRAGGPRLVVTPASCGGCGFVFRKRDRLGRPGRCPVCREESIAGPFFSVLP